MANGVRVQNYVVSSDLPRKSVIVTDDETEAWAEVAAIVRHGGVAIVRTAKDGKCVRHYDQENRPEVCECDHEPQTYMSRTGERCWCCFGKVA